MGFFGSGGFFQTLSAALDVPDIRNGGYRAKITTYVITSTRQDVRSLPDCYGPSANVQLLTELTHVNNVQYPLIAKPIARSENSKFQAFATIKPPSVSRQRRACFAVAVVMK